MNEIRDAVPPSSSSRDAELPANAWRVVADCADFLLIDKAPGVSVHRDDAAVGLVERVAADCGYEKLYLVHRLDRMTSGLLLLAKSAEACAALALLFAEHRVEKLYVALSDRRPLKKQGTIRGDMQRARNGSWRLTRELRNPAVTTFDSCSVKPGLRLFSLRPATGRTHQLRVALKSIGAPIIGDQRYGGSAADRGYLHASALRFVHAGVLFQFGELPQSGALFVDAEVAAALRMAVDRWLEGGGVAASIAPETGASLD